MSISHSLQMLKISDCWISILHQPSTSAPEQIHPTPYVHLRQGLEEAGKQGQHYLSQISCQTFGASPPRKPNKTRKDGEILEGFFPIHHVSIGVCSLVFISMDHGGYSIWWRLAAFVPPFWCLSLLVSPTWMTYSPPKWNKKTVDGRSQHSPGFGRIFMSSWWLNQPSWKICASQSWGSFPQGSGRKFKKYLKPPTSCCILHQPESFIPGKCFKTEHVFPFTLPKTN